MENILHLLSVHTDLYKQDKLVIITLDKLLERTNNLATSLVCIHHESLQRRRLLTLMFPTLSHILLEKLDNILGPGRGLAALHFAFLDEPSAAFISGEESSESVHECFEVGASVSVSAPGKGERLW